MGFCAGVLLGSVLATFTTLLVVCLLMAGRDQR
jgi:hypothetical protein